MPCGITQCYLPRSTGDIPTLTPAEAGTRLNDPGSLQMILTSKTDWMYKLCDLYYICNMLKKLIWCYFWKSLFSVGFTSPMQALNSHPKNCWALPLAHLNGVSWKFSRARLYCWICCPQSIAVLLMKMVDLAWRSCTRTAFTDYTV